MLIILETPNKALIIAGTLESWAQQQQQQQQQCWKQLQVDGHITVLPGSAVPGVDDPNKARLIY